MPRLELISFDDGFCRSYLEQFKQYASVPDDSRDALLNSLLKAAVLKVQEFADTPVAACTYRVTAAVPASGVVRLYMGGGNIVGLEDRDGESVRFDPLPGGKVQLFVRTGIVRITYETVPNDGDRDRYLQTVFRYGTALYDGEDPATLNRILMETL